MMGEDDVSMWAPPGKSVPLCCVMLVTGGGGLGMGGDRECVRNLCTFLSVLL